MKQYSSLPGFPCAIFSNPLLPPQKLIPINPHKMSEEKSQFKQFIDEGKDYIKFRLEYGKLTLTEKLVMLLSSLAVGLICVFLGVLVIFFLSVSAMDWIALYLGHAWAALIICGAYILLIILLIALRKPLVVNPMSRLISRIILK